MKIIEMKIEWRKGSYKQIWRNGSCKKMNKEREAIKNEWRKGSYKKWMKKGKL